MTTERLPVGWTTTRLGDVCRLRSGAGFPPSEQGRQGLELPFFKVGNLGDVEASELLTRSEHTIDRATAKQLHADIVPANSVVFAKIGMAIRLNRRRLTGPPCCIDNNMMAATPNGAIAPSYLLRYLSQCDFMPLAQATTVPSLRKSDLEELEVPLPPLAEQKRIVARLDDLGARSRRAKASLDAVPPLLDKLRQSILAAAFRGDLTADWRAKNPDVEAAAAHARDPDDTEDLIELPPGWRWTNLGNHLARIEAGASFKCEERPPMANEVGVVKVSAVTWGEYDENESKTCQDSDRVDPNLYIRAGDFLLSRANTINLVGTCVITQSASRQIMLSDKILRLHFVDVPPRWVLHALRSPWGRHEIERLASGNQESMRNIGQDRLRQIRLPLAPRAEMEAAIRRIEQSLRSATALLDRTDEATTSLRRLNEAVLAKAFRGELVPQDPNNEPAAVLLDRIRNARVDVTTAPRPRSTRTPTRTAELATVGPPAPAPPRADPQSALDDDALIAQVVAALWPHGPLDKDAAVRRLADYLRDAGHVTFQRLRTDGPLYAQLADAIDAAVKAGHFDRPKRGQVRACKPDATAYTADDWRHALLAVLSASPTDRDDAIRAAAEWARDNCGLEFTRLRADGYIVTGLRSALNSAIRAKLITRIDATRIARAPDSPADRQTTLFES